MRVYLCGPINNCTDAECMDWRERMKAELPNTCDPMDRDYRGKEDKFYKKIVELDKQDIRECDILLVNYDKPSVGTSMEILFAWLQDLPIIVVCLPETRISPWLRYHVTKFVHSFEDAVAWIREHDDVATA